MAAKKKVAKKAETKKKEPAAPVAAPTLPVELPKVSAQAVNKEKEAAFRNFMGQMKAKGGGTVVLASEAGSTYALRRPTGIMQLDIDMAGGFPAGGLSTIVGPDGTGKSELLYLTMAQHQAIYGNDSRIGIAHTEGQFDYWRAKRMGFHISVPKQLIEEKRAIRADRGQPDLTKEEIAYLRHGVGEVAFFYGSTGEEILSDVVEAVRSNAFGILAIDSLQGLIPQADAEKDIDENEKRAAFATLITRFMKHYIPLTAGIGDPNYTTLLAVSQVRANPDKGTNPYAPDFIAQLAKSMKHYHLIEVTLTTGSQVRKSIGGKDQTIGKELKWKLTKGKAGAHDNVTGSTSIIYPEYTINGQSVDVIDSVIVTGIRYGVIREARDGKAWVVRPSENDRQVVEPSPSIKTLAMMMKVDPEFEQTIRKEILLAAKLDCRYR